MKCCCLRKKTQININRFRQKKFPAEIAESFIFFDIKEYYECYIFSRIRKINNWNGEVYSEKLNNFKVKDGERKGIIKKRLNNNNNNNNE